MNERNGVLAVLLDWAGTTVDYGSRAPTRVFLEIFRRRGVEITVEEARGPMGMAKRDHILTVASLPRVSALWAQQHGRIPTSDDVDAMYAEFLPLQKETLATAGADVIPGIPAAIAELRSRGIRIGSTTGYTRALMDVVVPVAAQGGYSPEAIVCADDVPAGRPAPWMNYLAAQMLGVYPLSRVVVVDDTPVGLEAGRHAGAIVVGVTRTGNALGLSEAEAAAIPAGELRDRLARIEQDLRAAGAQYVVESAAELPALIARLEG